MQKPVAIPSGGIRIFRIVTAVRPSRILQTNTAAMPPSVATADNPGDSVIPSYLLCKPCVFVRFRLPLASQSAAGNP
jgi:hypothetical protein